MFKDNIKKLRTDAKLTQEELAKILNVERSTVGKWEGKNCVVPSTDVIRKICSYFNVTMDFLILGKEKAVTLSDDDLDAEFTSLFSQLGAVEQNIVLSQIKGILLAKEL